MSGLDQARCDDLEKTFGGLEQDDSGKKDFEGFIRGKMAEQVKGSVQDNAYSALAAKSKAAVWATGDIVVASGSSDGRDEKTDNFMKCEGDPKTCFYVVDRAVKLEQTIADQVQKRFGSSKIPFQREIKKLINSKPGQLFNQFWEDSVFSFDRKEWEEWVDRLIVDAERQLYELPDEQLKQLVGSEQPAAKGPKMVEKDLDLDDDVIKAKDKKWTTTKLDDDGLSCHSDAWTLLSTSQVYANLSQEDADRRWDGYQQGKPGFNERARELMRQDGVPRAQMVTAPKSAHPSVQPYQETVSWLIHPKSVPNPRMLVIHRTGAGTLSAPLLCARMHPADICHMRLCIAGKTCSIIRICDNFFKDKRPKIAIFPTPSVCSNFYSELMDPKFPNRHITAHPDGPESSLTRHA